MKKIKVSFLVSLILVSSFFLTFSYGQTQEKHAIEKELAEVKSKLNYMAIKIEDNKGREAFWRALETGAALSGEKMPASLIRSNQMFSLFDSAYNEKVDLNTPLEGLKCLVKKRFNKNSTIEHYIILGIEIMKVTPWYIWRKEQTVLFDKFGLKDEHQSLKSGRSIREVKVMILKADSEELLEQFKLLSEKLNKFI